MKTFSKRLIKIAAVSLIMLTSASLSADLKLTPPVTYTDGSPLTVVSYNIYCGTSLSNLIKVGSTTSLTINPDPCGPKSIYAVTAVDENGVESVYSNYRMINTPTLACERVWTVKYNTRNTTPGKEGWRPIKTIDTYQYIKDLYIAPKEICGDRASPNYNEYYRIVPGQTNQMVICE